MDSRKISSDFEDKPTMDYDKVKNILLKLIIPVQRAKNFNEIFNKLRFVLTKWFQLKFNDMEYLVNFEF